jgi:hypothetical protein
MIAPAKLRELSVLAEPNIIRPEKILLDARKTPVGYSMRYVDRARALCQIFPRAFRVRNNLSSGSIVSLVRRLQDGVRYVHSKGILIVDLNELNFLISDDFTEIYFIDVDSYQTPSFPATALMESVRDRHSHGFSEKTDWFSFAVVSFQMFVGIHPYKGIFRFGAGFATFDVRAVLDVQFSGLNFTVLDTGICLHLTENDELEVFSAAMGSDAMRVISDTAIAGDARLFHLGRQALIARGNRLYRFSMR